MPNLAKAALDFVRGVAALRVQAKGGEYQVPGPLVARIVRYPDRGRPRARLAPKQRPRRGLIIPAISAKILIVDLDIRRRCVAEFLFFGREADPSSAIEVGGDRRRIGVALDVKDVPGST